MFSSLALIPEPRATPATVDVGHYWAQMTVKDYAARALRVVTGRVLDARTFPAWWNVHGDARNSLWFWQERFSREMEAARQGLRASPPPAGPADAARDAGTAWPPCVVGSRRSWPRFRPRPRRRSSSSPKARTPAARRLRRRRAACSSIPGPSRRARPSP